MLARFAMAVGILAAALLPQTANAERRVALVVGNSGYKHATALRNPGNDATDVAETLKKLGFEVLLGRDLDQQDFAKTIEQFARVLDDADIGLFFYAGHGLQMNDKNYLVSTNARLENEFLLSSETIELDAIVRLMESKAPTNLVFLDACRNNPLTENLRRSLTALKRSAQLGRGLARMEATGRDTLVAFAAAPGQEANDGGGDRNSPFTAALLRHLPKPGLEVSVMLKEVAADVRRDTRNSQRPQQLSDMTKAFYFAKAEQLAASRIDAPSPAPQMTTTPAAPAGDNTALDMAFWNAAQSSNDCDAVRAYLQRFPRGVFVELAKLSERRLCTAGRKVSVVEPSAAEAASSSAAAVTLVPPAPAPDAKVTRANPPAPVAVAALPDAANVAPPSAPIAALMPSPVELTRVIQLELYRLGCGTSEADGKWTVVTREGLRKFNLRTKVKTRHQRALERDRGRASEAQRAHLSARMRTRHGRARRDLRSGRQARAEEVAPRGTEYAVCTHTGYAVCSDTGALRSRASRRGCRPEPVHSPPMMMGPPMGMGGMMFFGGFGRRRF